jgi:radical SAM protein with 4Fe4S-binding SPASM domain
MFETVQEIILKVTRDCNLRCQYCYIRHKDDYRGERMSLDTFQQLIAQVITDKQKNMRLFSPENLQIVFHGGEPTLLGLERTKQFVDYALGKIPGVRFSMQTNLTNIDEDWIDFLKKYDISIGSSLDGISWQDNILRKPKYNLLKKMKQMCKRGVRSGVLMVVSKANVRSFMRNAKRILKLFPQQQMIKANFVEDFSSSVSVYPEVSAQEMYTYVFLPVMKHFLKKSFVLESNVQMMLDAFVQEILFVTDKALSRGCLGNCMLKFCAGGHAIVEVDPQGNVCSCGRWSDANAVNVLGNFLKPQDLFGLQSYAVTLKLHLEKIKDIRKKQCDFCFAQDVCQYGCIAFSYEKYDGEIKIRDDLFCSYAQQVKTYFLEHQAEIYYCYAQAKGAEIIQDKQFYYINIVPQARSIRRRENKEKDICWVEHTPGKWYVRVSKRLIHRKLHV